MFLLFRRNAQPRHHPHSNFNSRFINIKSRRMHTGDNSFFYIHYTKPVKTTRYQLSIIAKIFRTHP